jgi:hypothetical protein
MHISLFVTALLMASAASVSVSPLIPAQEAEVALTVMAGIRGTCRSFTIGDRSETCSTILYQQYANGRGVFLLPIGKGLFALSGGSDERTSPTDYVLHLDAVRVAKEGGEVVTHEAAGECRVKTNRGADRFDRIDCDARADVLGEIHLRFVGNGKRADIQVIKPPR